MLRQFAQKIEDLRRLIDDSRSASSSHSASTGPVVPSERSGSRNLSFLLAVSGGMDSMCLLDLFSRILSPSDYAVAHCNFSLRGDESDGDQALVETHASELGARIFVKRFDTEAYAREKCISIEMAARELRYEWFGQLCHEHGFDVLAVAHNANDNAETLMLNILRGTGLNGLHGMETYSTMVVGSFDDGEDMLPPAMGCTKGTFGITNGRQSITVFRPLLEFTRKQIEGYVLNHRVPYRNDSSNFESEYKRNKIRNEVFPVFEKINPSFIRTLNREIGYFAEAGSIVEDWCRSMLPSVMSSDHGESGHLHIDTAALLATPHWSYILYYILESYGFNSLTIESIESLLVSDRTLSGKRFDSPTHTLHTTRNELLLVPHGRHNLHSPNVLSDDVAVVRGPGMYCFNGSSIRVEVLEWSPDMPLKQPQGTLILDADKMGFPFVCRRWRQGDWLIPLGMKGKKKVSDMFTDLKYNVLEKDSAIMIVEGLAERQHVAGILGVRIDECYKVTMSTTTVIRITL